MNVPFRNRQLGEVMERAFHGAGGMAHERAVCNRAAAHVLAVQRLAEAVRPRGIYP